MAHRVVYAVAVASTHRLEAHLEHPARVDAIVEKLLAAGLTPAACPGQLCELPCTEKAGLEDVRGLHSYVDELQRLAREEAPTEVADIGDPDGVTYVTSSSFDDALRAAGAATALVDAVVAASTALTSGGASSPSGPLSGFCITRPPGHHATPDTPLGYCLLNHVALAARHAQRRHGLPRVCILDFDLHHGNGTAAIFSRDPSVLFIDIHEASSIYPPPHESGAAEDNGEGAGRGTTINVPLPRNSGEASVLSVFDSLVTPAVRRFKPDILLVSAGFDAHWQDPFQLLQFRSSTYGKLAVRLRELASELCEGRLLLILEGGYDLAAVSESVSEVFLALLDRDSVEGQEALQLPNAEPVEEVHALVTQLRKMHDL